jgi:glucose/arabinose dehydrogenase
MGRRSVLFAALMLAGCGGGGGGPPPPPPPPANLAPVITIASAATFAEGEIAAIDFTLSDPEGARPMLMTLAGEDAAEFDLSSGGSGNNITGTLHRRGPNSEPPDYEWPTDVGRDNVYNVTVRATDGVNIATRDVRFTITNVVDTPVVTRIGTGFDELVTVATLPPNQNIATSVSGGSEMFGVVAERKGMIYAIRDNRSVDQSKVFLDLTSEVSTQDGMGILGVTIFDEGASWGLDYINAELFVLMSNLQGDTELRQYLIRRDFSEADKATMSLVLKVAQPPGLTGNRGGMLTIANNRMLVGIGDGGGTGDPGGNAQNLNSFLGKVLRINPNGDGFPSDPNRNYMIPFDNPVLNGVRQEIWATGLRNPVQGAFDPRGFHTYVLDAGEGGIEEINRLPWEPAGVANFGWPRRLGVNAYNGGADDPAFVRPVAVYAPGASAARRMSAGAIYWGRAEAHQGELFFGDTMSDQLRSFRVQTLVDGQALTTFNNVTADLTPDAGRIDAPVAITSDDRRDMFILDGDGEIFRYHKAGT